MLMKQFFQHSFRSKQYLRPLFLGIHAQRAFALPKYKFDDESFEADRFQASNKTHKSNAEELINALPIVEVDGDTARCTGVNELGLGHPVQYIQVNRRYEHTPATCKWCGLRFRKREGDHHHH